MVDLITALNNNLEIAEIPLKYRIDNDRDQVDYEHEEYDDKYDDSESKEDSDQVDYEHEEYDDKYDDSESKEDYSNNRQG
jgi:hypothetical protein